MTAEIGILNRQGVALAADSAVTFGGSENPKILNSANKLFNLVKGMPIGIMVYGNGSFMGLPWEVVIEEYRKHISLSDIKFDTLEEASNSFINFLGNPNKFYRNTNSEAIIYNNMMVAVKEITEIAGNEIYNIFVDRHPTVKESDDIFIEVLNRIVEDSKNREFVEGFSEDDIEYIKSQSESVVRNISDRLVVKLDEENIEKLKILAGNLICKDIWLNQTGIVIAGYGESDLLPVLQEFYTEGIINGKLKYKLNKVSEIYQDDIDGHPTAEIVPFAQQEMVYSILTGIDQNLEMFLMQNLENSYSEIMSYIINMLQENGISLLNKENNKMENGVYIDSIAEYLINNLNELKSNITNKQREKFINPILDMVSLLPKEELAIMAETLVNITSFKRKFTFDAETVGGPIDVAIISKSDGFIWIKRKHYFSKELNHSYFNINK
ncbi:hypothetical protein [Romboutsia sp. 1001285H_161024_C4]|uniref:hypothetical protein n=1 Tax=Romboutsia sp. 1001285H_161024_C4 TaxID=2787109 RepID=UPI0018974FB3|nr:hypothetical protein [Romboutsia sp. 1001285H_161024_C4]